MKLLPVHGGNTRVREFEKSKVGVFEVREHRGRRVSSKNHRVPPFEIQQIKELYNKIRNCGESRIRKFNINSQLENNYQTEINHQLSESRSIHPEDRDLRKLENNIINICVCDLIYNL